MTYPPESVTPALTAVLTAMGWTGGPIDNFLKEKGRNLVMDATAPEKFMATVPEWFPDATPNEVDVLARLLSRTARKRILPHLE
jgi:hypothetical protein